jgi:hypothetical protein
LFQFQRNQSRKKTWTILIWRNSCNGLTKSIRKKNCFRWCFLLMFTLRCVNALKNSMISKN